MRPEAPWWLPFVFLGAYASVLVAMVSTGHIAPREFEAQFALILNAAFAIQIIPSKHRVDDVDVQAEGDVTVTKKEKGLTGVDVLLILLTVAVFLLILGKLHGI